MKKIFLLLFLSLSVGLIHAQTVVINEVMIRPNNNDGTSFPNAGDWFELYNTTNVALDISCYTVNTKLFYINFPPGTVIAPNDFFTIGGNNAGVNTDYNWSIVGNATSINGGTIGPLSNNQDFIALFDNNQNFIDGIIYKSAANAFPTLASVYPLNFTNTNGCSNVSIPNLTIAMFNPSNIFTYSSTIPIGKSKARKCDGSSIWEDRAGLLVTGDASNGQPPIVNFLASDTTICETNCISFQDLSIPISANISAWNWTFSGSNIVSSTNQNPTNICFPNSGFYDVKLEVSNGCGTFDKIKTAYINVINPVTPILAAPGSATCTTINVVLSITNQSYTSYQWNLNNVPIAGATLDSLVAAQTGNFSVTVVDQGCTVTSTPISVSGPIILNPTITASGPTNLCFGGSVTLTGNSGGFTYQWLLNNVPILGANSANISATSSGNYSLIESLGSCSDTSAIITVSISPQINAAISPAASTTICSYDSVTYAAAPTGTYTYSWTQNGNPLTTTISSLVAKTSGTFSVIVTDANSCTASSSATLVVNNFVLPTITSTVPSLSLCTTPNMILSVPNNYVTYQWLNGTNTGIAGANTNSLLVSSADVYSLVVTDANGCTDTTMAIVVTSGFNQTIAIAASGPTTFCAGNSVTITATSFTNVIYQWFNGVNPLLGQNLTSLSVNTTGNYAVLISDVNGCTAFSSATVVQVNALPVSNIVASGALTFCQGQNVALSSSTVAASYSWLNNNSIIAGATSNSFNANLPGSFSLIVTDLNGCKDTSNVIVTDTTIAFNISFASSTGDFGICQGGTMQLTSASTSGISYQWTLDGNPIIGNTSTINVVQNGNYSVIVSDVNGCTNQNTQTISLFSPPIPIIFPSNQVTICSGNSVTLFTNSFASYSWFLNGTIIPNETLQQISTNQSGAYTVLVLDSRGCQGTSSVKNVTTAPIPTPTIASTTNEVCEGQTRSIYVVENFDIYKWSTSEFDKTIDVTSAGLYWVEVIDVNNCKGYDSVFVDFKPNPTLILPQTLVLPCGEPDSLRAITNGVTIGWFPTAGLSSSSVANPSIKVTKETYYVATVTLNGCVTKDSILVQLGKCDSLYIPTAFTPNDDDYNQVFKVYGSGIKLLKLQIFDRWGKMIFFSSDPDVGWDGKYFGVDCQTGVYTWQVEAYDYFEKPMLTKSKSGQLVLIR